MLKENWAIKNKQTKLDKTWQLSSFLCQVTHLLASLFHTQTFFKDLDEHCKGLDAILQSGADEEVSVDASLLKEVDSRIKAVQDKSADRLLRLAYENARTKMLGLLDAGRKQLNIQPVKYSSQAHVEKALREYTVSIQCSYVKTQILLTCCCFCYSLCIGEFSYRYSHDNLTPVLLGFLSTPMTGSEANPRWTLQVKGKLNSLFPARLGIKCFAMPSKWKKEQTEKKELVWRQLAHMVYDLWPVSRSSR